MKSKENPFASRHIESLAYHCVSLNWEGILQRLSALNYRAAITGPEGSGKTTLLEEIGGKLSQKGFDVSYFRYDPKAIQKIISRIRKHTTPTTVFLIDSAHQINWLTWKRLSRYIRKAGGVIITAHKTTKLPVLVKTTTSPALLYDLVLELVGQGNMISREKINHLFRLHNGNIRLAFRELYDLWAERG